jgi:hypothetical protein
VDDYAVLGVQLLLAQVVQIPHSQGTQLETERDGNRKRSACAKGGLAKQVDSAGNTIGSDQPFGWREQIDCADETRKGGHL